MPEKWALDSPSPRGAVATLPERPPAHGHPDPRAACLNLRTAAALAGVRGSLRPNGPPGSGTQVHALPAWACAQLQLWPAFEDCVVTLPERPPGRWHPGWRAACLDSRPTAALAGVRGPLCPNGLLGSGALRLARCLPGLAHNCGSGRRSRVALSLCQSGPPGTGAQTRALPAWAHAQLQLSPTFEGHFA